jgi:CheY-like chemotaxis protein
MSTMLLLAPDETEAGGWLPEPTPEGFGHPFRPQRRVLVAEDDPLVRSMLERLLLDLGYEVHTASHGEEALAVALSLDPPVDIVVTDVRMPRMSGPELGRRLNERWPGMPVLYISGYDVEGSTTDDPAHRRSAFLKKPFDPDELARRVARLLGDA